MPSTYFMYATHQTSKYETFSHYISTELKGKHILSMNSCTTAKAIIFKSYTFGQTKEQIIENFTEVW